MSQAEQLWDAFVATARADSRALDDGVASLRPDLLTAAESRRHMGQLAYRAFQIASQSLLLGAEDLSQLALACERCLDLLADEQLTPEHALPILASSTYALRRAIEGLSVHDRSGALTDRRSLEAACYELETLFPVPGAASAAVAAGAPDVPVSALTRRPQARDTDAQGGLSSAEIALLSGAPEPAPRTGQVWQPDVAEDMLELFFEEADERIEDLSVKLLDVEKRPDDSELLRDVFRDLHTLKGSSAMVALQPMNELAHAAEDLVGQLREGHTRVDGAVIDAMLAALDGLRDILALAKDGRVIDADLGPIIQHLRAPHAAAAQAASEPPGATDAPADADGSGDAPREPSPGRDAVRSPSARQTIRVDFDKLDRLMNLVGELVLGRDQLHHAIQSLSAMSTELSSDRHLTRRLMSARQHASRGGERHRARDALNHLSDEIGRVERVLVDISQDLGHATGRLDSVSDDLRDQVMKLRMIPIGGVFRKHHRTVRDLATSLGKRARLDLVGEDTELDKLLVEALDEPLMHLIRNAVDHGIEPPDARIAAGKRAEGRIRVSAAHRGNQMFIEIADDGNGIDPVALRERARDRALVTEDELETFDDRQILDVIFRPGFSTAATVSQVSGRGVGMDVVRQAIVTQLKGTIDIDSAPGQGTTFTLKLPLTLAIIQVLLARAGGEIFAIPLDQVLRTIACAPEHIQLVQDREVIAVRGRQVPLVRLTSVLQLATAVYDPHATLRVVLTEVGGSLYGLACDHLIGKKEIVIKSLGTLLQNVPCAAGATLLGDRCALILDVPAIIQRALHIGTGPTPLRPPAVGSRPPTPTDHAAPHILVVEDSDTVRESLRRLLVDAGYRCTVASDGVEGLNAASHTSYDLISTDVMMPRMDGYDLTRALRAMPAYRDVPIVMVTSRGERIDRVRGFDAGVDDYITKPHDRQLLLRAVRKLLGNKPRTSTAPGDNA